MTLSVLNLTQARISEIIVRFQPMGKEIETSMCNNARNMLEEKSTTRQCLIWMNKDKCKVTTKSGF